MGKKILVVDDEKPICELLRHKLSLEGFDVITARNEKEVWDHAFANRPDLLILDIWLKGRIGTDIYNNLLNFGFDPQVPVIFITALVGGHPKASPGVPADKKYALYSKPIDFEKLLKEIRQLLNLPRRETV